MPQFVNRLRDAIGVRWDGLKRRRPALDHFVRAYGRYKDNHGDFLAAGIVYFSFLALFPLVFVSISVTGFVLDAHPTLVNDINDAIDRNVPGQFGKTLKDTVKYAIDNKKSVGLIGLVGFAWTGLGWTANLRTAIDIVWGVPKVERNFFISKLMDALVLVGLGLGILVSVGLTAAGTAASGRFIEWIQLDDATVAANIVKVVGILLAVVGDLLVFSWLLIRLPHATPSPQTALRTALLAAVGFEVLKFIGTYYVARLTQSPAAAALGAIVGVLIFMDIVARYLLYCTAWAATAGRSSRLAIADEIPVDVSDDSPEHAADECDKADERDEAGRPPISPAGIAAGLLTAGAAAGAAAAVGSQRWRRKSRARRAATRR